MIAKTKISVIIKMQIHKHVIFINRVRYWAYHFRPIIIYYSVILKCIGTPLNSRRQSFEINNLFAVMLSFLLYCGHDRLRFWPWDLP